jgi:hypothetical protein
MIFHTYVRRAYLFRGFPSLSSPSPKTLQKGATLWLTTLFAVSGATGCSLRLRVLEILSSYVQLLVKNRSLRSSTTYRITTKA